MGNQIIHRINFEDIQFAQNNGTLIISTLPDHEQGVLIARTVPSTLEIAAVERALKQKQKIIVYGRHSNDDTIYKKYEQLKKLNADVCIYTGGLFEWLLLQDIYGKEGFPTTSKTLDLLKYKPPTVLNTKYLTYSWQEDS
jgi:hypothetical protein